MGVRYQKYRSIAIPLNIGIELSQVSRYFDIFGIEPALVLSLTNYVLIKYAINKDVLAQYSCTLNVLVILIEYHLNVIPSC